MPLPTTAREAADLLGLQPHPEGGYFRETFRDVAGPDGRARSTAIYYLLPAGGKSHLHMVDAAEVWHWHGGNPITIVELVGGSQPVRLTELGDDLLGGQVPQHVVPAGVWFGALARGDAGYSLVGCTVAPGFVWEGFTLGDRARLLQTFLSDAEQAWIVELTRDPSPAQAALPGSAEL